MSAEPEEPLDRTPMWTLDELCAVLRTTPATVHTWRKHGRAPKAYKIGRHLLFEGACTLKHAGHQWHPTWLV